MPLTRKAGRERHRKLYEKLQEARKEIRELKDDAARERWYYRDLEYAEDERDQVRAELEVVYASLDLGHKADADLAASRVTLLREALRRVGGDEGSIFTDEEGS